MFEWIPLFILLDPVDGKIPKEDVKGVYDVCHGFSEVTDRHDNSGFRGLCFGGLQSIIGTRRRTIGRERGRR